MRVAVYWLAVVLCLSLGLASEAGQAPLTFSPEEAEGHVSDPLFYRALDLLEHGHNRHDAVKLLTESDSNDSLLVLADMHFYSNYSMPRDFATALQYYQQLADRGNASGQFMVGLAHATGLFGNLTVDQSKAALYYWASAVNGDPRAQLAMGYRMMNGIGSARDPKAANEWYRPAARQALNFYHDGPNGMPRHLAQGSWSIADELAGGVYGNGASASSSGLQAKRSKLLGGPSAGGSQSIDKAIQYYHYLADESDMVTAHLALAFLYYKGGAYFEPDYNRSVVYAQRCAHAVWTRSGNVKASAAHTPGDTLRAAARCAAHVGATMLKGEGVQQADPVTALKWLQRGVQYMDAEARTLLGALHLGIFTVPGLFETTDTKQDPSYGMKLLVSAVNDGHPGAASKLSYYYWTHGEVQEAIKYAYMVTNMKSQSIESNAMEAYYVLGEYLSDLGYYEDANLYLKLVAERPDTLHSPLLWAQRQFRAGDTASAALGFLIGAEEGFRTAQSNLAYLLEDDYLSVSAVPQGFRRAVYQLWQTAKTVLIKLGVLPAAYIPPPVISLSSRPAFADNLKTALVYWTRAARQHDLDANVKMGDYYFDGLGSTQDYEKASQCYTAAAEGGVGLANWNLGYMHETGLGAAKDYHLAKRYYDLALSTSPEAILPVRLSVARLYAKSLWNKITGGQVRGIVRETPENAPMTLGEFWKTLWKKWGEMEFSVWEEDETVDEDIEDDGMFASSVLLLVVTIVFLLIWARNRRIQGRILRDQNANRMNPNQDQNRNENENQNQDNQEQDQNQNQNENGDDDIQHLRRRLGAHLEDNPADNPIPVMYM